MHCSVLFNRLIVLSAHTKQLGRLPAVSCTILISFCSLQPFSPAYCDELLNLQQMKLWFSQLVLTPKLVCMN